MVWQWELGVVSKAKEGSCGLSFAFVALAIGMGLFRFLFYILFWHSIDHGADNNRSNDSRKGRDNDTRVCI
ncbi:hypothetical protein [Anaerotignum sp.]|uniref:hypothetical protein n=1 Tax=Anaerotignum sp. TaxID=2039241 RepID=UPI002714F35E|nr:hypothetical protein [Anaerotignum sp.]